MGNYFSDKLLASMIGMHSEVAMLIEDLRGAVRRVVGKKVVGNKVCIPNQLELSRKAGLVRTAFNQFAKFRALNRSALFKTLPVSRYSIEDYLELDGIKFVAIIRNENDVISSIIRRGGVSLEVATYRWCRAIEIIYELKNRYVSEVMVVTFEHLVENPESVMKKLAHFIGLEYQDEMLNGYMYNPKYVHYKGIRRDKANRHLKENINYDIMSKHPSVYAKYQELVALARED